MSMERLVRPAGIQDPNGRIATMRKLNAILDRRSSSLAHMLPIIPISYDCNRIATALGSVAIPG